MTIEDFVPTASNLSIPDTQIEKIFFDIVHHASKEMHERALSVLKEHRPALIQSWRWWPNSCY